MIPTQTSTAIPTNRHPYSVLERLANSGLIEKEILSWIMAPGKGESALSILPDSLPFHRWEYDERIFSGAEENRLHAVSGNRTAF